MPQCTQTKDRSADRHKPGARLARIRRVQAWGIERLMDMNGTDWTSEVNRLLAEALYREGVLPRLDH